MSKIQSLGTDVIFEMFNDNKDEITNSAHLLPQKTKTCSKREREMQWA